MSCNALPFLACSEAFWPAMFVRCRGGGGDGQNTIEPLHLESPLLPSDFFLIFSVFIFSIPSESVNDMFWSMIVFLGSSQWHYNLRLTERAKMTLSRAQNIVIPKNIKFVLFNCNGPFGPELVIWEEGCRYVWHSELSNVFLVSSENKCGHLDAFQGIRLPFVNT